MQHSLPQQAPYQPSWSDGPLLRYDSSPSRPVGVTPSNVPSILPDNRTPSLDRPWLPSGIELYKRAQTTCDNQAKRVSQSSMAITSSKREAEPTVVKDSANVDMRHKTKGKSWIRRVVSLTLFDKVKPIDKRGSLLSKRGEVSLAKNNEVGSSLQDELDHPHGYKNCYLPPPIKESSIEEGIEFVMHAKKKGCEQVLGEAKTTECTISCFVSSSSGRWWSTHK